MLLNFTFSTASWHKRPANARIQKLTVLQRNQFISIYWSRNILWICDSLSSERLKSYGSISHCYHSVYNRKLLVEGLMKTQLTAKWKKKQEITEINEEAEWEAERVELLLVSMVWSTSLLIAWAHNPHYHEGSEFICCTLWPLCWQAWHYSISSKGSKEPTFAYSTGLLVWGPLFS